MKIAESPWLSSRASKIASKTTRCGRQYECSGVSVGFGDVTGTISPSATPALQRSPGVLTDFWFRHSRLRACTLLGGGGL